MTYETFYERQIGRVLITASAAHDEDTDLSWDDTGEVMRNLASGAWGCWSIRVRVQFGPWTGEDYLGGCIGDDPMGTVKGSYWPDMVRAAIQDLRHNYSTARSNAQEWASEFRHTRAC